MNVLIIGGGKVGTRLAEMLLAEKHAVTVIEQSAEKVAHLRQNFGDKVVVHGNGTEPTVLQDATIRTAQVVAAVTGHDEVNLVITSLARFEFDVPRTIARVNNPKNHWMFTKRMGVDVGISQADLIAHLILEEMSLGDMLTLLKLRRGQYSLVEEKVHPQAAAVGKQIRELQLPENCRIVGVIRHGQLLMSDELVLQPIDEVLAVVHAAQVPALAAWLGAST